MELSDSMFKLIDIAVSIFVLVAVLYFGYKEYKTQRNEFMEHLSKKDEALAKKDAEYVEQLKFAYETLNLVTKTLNELKQQEDAATTLIQSLIESTDRRLIIIARQLKIEDSNFFA